MRLSLLAVSLAVAAGNVAAQVGDTIKVDVGANGDLTYTPNNFNATVGTKIEFHFFPKNHTVTQSSFKEPCHPLLGGFFSGFVPIGDSSAKATFTIEVKDNDPIWFFCGQADHCQRGMIGAINASTTGNTFDAFSKIAMESYNSTSPQGGPVGGDLNNGDSQPPSSTMVQPTVVTSYKYTCSPTVGSEMLTTTTTTTITEDADPTPQPALASTSEPCTTASAATTEAVFATVSSTAFLFTPSGGGNGSSELPPSSDAAAASVASFSVCLVAALAASISGIL